MENTKDHNIPNKPTELKDNERDKNKIKEKDREKDKDKDKDKERDKERDRERDHSKDRKSNEKDDDDRDKSREKDKKRKKKNKKHKKKNKKRDDDDYLDGYDGKNPSKKIKTSAVLDNKNIPEEYREKYHEIEKNPLKIIVANIPLGVTLDELRGYFNTLIASLKTNLSIICSLFE